ncbi:MAG: winged helix DNA-binding protein [Erythrobacter sp.]|nr:winged helix DNA-binding protein [Erythrobacter sp.]
MKTLTPSAPRPQAKDLLDDAARSLTPSELRRLGDSLLRLADAVDQDWQPPKSKSIFRWPNELSGIEKNAYNLAVKAQVEYSQRRARRKHFPGAILAEPGWDMLLELFMQFAGKAKVSTTSLCIAADCPTSTALRYIGLLEEEGLVRRTPAVHDRRVTFVELTDAGVLAMGRYLGAI